MASVHDFHPEAHRVALLVDDPDWYFDPEAEPFEILRASALGIPFSTSSNVPSGTPLWSHFSFKYDLVELNTAVKPYFLRWLFDHYPADHIVYLDPDILLFSRL